MYKSNGVWTENWTQLRMLRSGAIGQLEYKNGRRERVEVVGKAGIMNHINIKFQDGRILDFAPQLQIDLEKDGEGEIIGG